MRKVARPIKREEETSENQVVSALKVAHSLIDLCHYSCVVCKKSSNADANVRPPSDFEKCKAKVRRDAGSSKILAPWLLHDR